MIVYLASPYTHADPDVRERRFREVCRVAGALMARGVHVFSPIAHTHPIATRQKLPGDWDFWEEYDRKFLAVCGELWVATMQGWTTSRGVRAEIGIAESLNLPVRYLDPVSLMLDQALTPTRWADSLLTGTTA